MFGAFLDGWRRASRAPALAVSILAAMFLMSVPLAMTPGDLVGPDILRSVEIAIARANAAWTIELGGLPTSPGGVALREILGLGSTLAAAYLLFWAFLAGGILDRLARDRPVGTAQFFASCGVYLLRFIRLGLLVAVAYYVLFRIMRPLIGQRLELAAFLAALALVNLVADFAKVRAVVEDRRSVIGAVAAALRFIRHRPVRATGLYAINLLTAVALTLAWQRMALTAGRRVWIAFALAQGYLLVKIVARLAFMASETVFLQRELAHAEYTAAPEVLWPDSPAVEAIRNLTDEKRSP